MSPAAIVTAVIGTFFLIGIAVGVLLVIAISALRVSTTRVERKLARPSWEEPSATDEDDEDEGPPRWPRHRGLPAGSG